MRLGRTCFWIISPLVTIWAHVGWSRAQTYRSGMIGRSATWAIGSPAHILNSTLMIASSVMFAPMPEVEFTPDGKPLASVVKGRKSNRVPTKIPVSARQRVRPMLFSLVRFGRHLDAVLAMVGRHEIHTIEKE